jgi:hypothetical protein
VRIEPLVGTTNPFVGAYTAASNLVTSFAPEFYSGADESMCDVGVGASDAAVIHVDAGASVGAVVVITNAEPPAPFVTSATYVHGRLKIKGGGFVRGTVRCLIDGVPVAEANVILTGVSASGVARKIVCRALADRSVMGRSLVVENTVTGRCSADVEIRP